MEQFNGHKKKKSGSDRVQDKNIEPVKMAWNDIRQVETARGSVYRYLPNGTTQRFKAVEGKEYDPQSALVYVPDFAWIQQNAPSDVLKKFENEALYEEILLEYVQNPHKDGRGAYIVDSSGKYIETNEEVWSAKQVGEQVFLSLTKGKKADVAIPVSHKPIVGWMTFDTRKYTDPETGEHKRERHLGNPVVKITLKDGAL